MKLRILKKGGVLRREFNIYSFKPIYRSYEIERHLIKNSIGISESDILIDATIPFQGLGDMTK